MTHQLAASDHDYNYAIYTEKNTLRAFLSSRRHVQVRRFNTTPMLLFRDNDEFKTVRCAWLRCCLRDAGAIKCLMHRFCFGCRLICSPAVLFWHAAGIVADKMLIWRIALSFII